MANGLVLFRHRLVRLRIFVADGSLATVVKEKLGLVKVFPVARHKIKFGECHLHNLMPRYNASLPCCRSHLPAYAIGIADGDVEELPRACGLVMRDGTLYHVAEIIQLVAETLFLRPSLAACPLVRMCRVLRACGVQVAVRLLRGANDVKDGVDISLQLLVRVGLQHIRCTLDGFVRVGVIEGKAAYAERFR